MTSAHDVVSFWHEAGPQKWFRKDEAFDALFRERFLATHKAAAHGELDPWIQEPEGALALVVLLDQFPRNAFRASPRMYATDAKARDVARAAIEWGFDLQVDPALRPFFYLPLMHSELLADHDRSVELARPLGGEHERYAQHHRAIIERFGRFPHRNAILGRTSTPEEAQFLEEGGFAG
jgi:uncharacterized protein (DUF924 family)